MASCMFIGGVIHPQFVGRREQEKQQRMADAVKNDIQRMLEFANVHSRVVSSRKGNNYIHNMRVNQILLNEDIADTMSSQIHQTQLGGSSQSLLAKARFLSYSNKEQVRHLVRSYLNNDVADSLILFMTGHGDQNKPAQLVEESFAIPTQGSRSVEHYTDAELTADIVKALPDHKKLYLVIHSCHSGGMVNFWQLDARHKWVALFASAEADILAEWNADEEHKGFVDAFCSQATRGKQLNSIAESILLSLYSVRGRIRPAFKTTRPSIVAEKFLE